MAETATPTVLPDLEQDEQTRTKESLDRGFLVICWDDPVNLMDYVTHVFQTVSAGLSRKPNSICSKSTTRARAF